MVKHLQRVTSATQRAEEDTIVGVGNRPAEKEARTDREAQRCVGVPCRAGGHQRVHSSPLDWEAGVIHLRIAEGQIKKGTDESDPL